MPTEIIQSVLIAVGTAISLAIVWWVKKKFIDPSVLVFRRLTTLVQDVQQIKAEVKPDSGQSMKDQVNQISESIAMVEARQRSIMQGISRATFEADSEFNWRECNISLERMTGFACSHLERRRWLSRVHDEDRPGVIREILSAVSEKREAAAAFRFMNEDDDIIKLRLEASPVFSPVEPNRVLCWSGVLVREDIREQRRSGTDRRLG